jgi:hypothetical protein
VIATVNVATGRNQPTIHQISEVFPDVVPIDRTSINAWEDADFVAAVRNTGRKKLIMTALWTEVCLVHPALDALQEGFEVYPVVDAVGGTSREAHDAGLLRIGPGHPAGIDRPADIELMARRGLVARRLGTRRDQKRSGHQRHCARPAKPLDHDSIPFRNAASPQSIALSIENITDLEVGNNPVRGRKLCGAPVQDR